MRYGISCAYLAAAALASAVYFSLDRTPAAVLYAAIGAACAAALAVAARRDSEDRRGWALAAVAVALFVLGDVIFSVHEAITGAVPVPSPADGAYVLGYCFLVAAVAAMTRRTTLGVTIDAAIVGAVALLLVWTLVLDGAGTEPFGATTTVGYLVLDVFLLALVARLVFAGRASDARLLGVVAALGALLVADALYAGDNFGSGYVSGSAADALWLASYAILGAGALLPRRRGATPVARHTSLTPRRVGVLAAAIAGGNLAVALQHEGAGIDLALFAGTALVALLALARAWNVTCGLERALARTRRSETQLRELLGTIAAVVSEEDAHGERTYLSGDLARISGFGADELRRPGFWQERVPPEDLTRIRELWRQAVADGTGFAAEYRFLRADGEVAWLRVTSRVVRDGGEVRTRSVTVDVTELAAAVASQERASSLLEATLDATADGILVTDLDGAVLKANGRASALWSLPAFGVQLAELVGRAAGGGDDIVVRAHAVPEAETQDVIELRDGRVVEAASAPQRVADEIVGRVWSFRDVTAARDAEERLRRRGEYFRSLIENSSDIITVLAPDGTILDESPSAARILGREHNALVGQSCFDYIHPDDLPRLQAAFEAGASGGASTWASVSDYRFRHANGSWRRLESLARLHRGEQGEPIVIVNSRDVTERRELEEQLLHAQKLEAVGRLAGGVAHDFNNLLTAITGYAEFLQSSLDSGDDRREDVGEIVRAAERAAALTAQLLAFSRRQVLQPEVVDVGQAVRELENLLGRLLGADVVLSTRAEPGCFAEVDRSQLEQVIANLAVNARDAMPKGGRLTIDTALDASGDHVEITVSDTGVGMDEDTLEHAFEPFFTTKDSGKGTGLGLATVYGIVTQSGGEVLVSSGLGIGTTFVVRLPRASAGAPAQEQPAPARRIERGAETILLVEDEELIRRLLREVLTRSGHTVLDAPAGEEALALLREHEVDLLLTDVVMPGLSGPELARLVGDERPHLPILFMSGYTNRPEDVFAEGGAAFIGKPFSPQELVAKVREVLDLRDAA